MIPSPDSEEPHGYEKKGSGSTRRNAVHLRPPVDVNVDVSVVVNVVGDGDVLGFLRTGSSTSPSPFTSTFTSTSTTRSTLSERHCR